MSEKRFWNQIIFDSNDSIESGLVSLIGWTPNRQPKCIGTAFIISASGTKALAITAAHNFTEGLRNIHSRYRSHGSTLPEFLPDHMNLQQENVRGVYKVGNKVEACILAVAGWDKKADLAFLELALQSNDQLDFFQKAFLIDDIIPQVGEEIVVIGYAHMGTSEELIGAGNEQFKFSRHLTCRAGIVIDVFPEGYPPIHGICIKTTIPVFGGMSGGPCFTMESFRTHTPKPFALISRDQEVNNVGDKNNMMIQGNSILTKLNCAVEKLPFGKQRVKLHFQNPDVRNS